MSDSSRAGVADESQGQAPAAIGITMSLKAPIGLGNDADIVYFVRLKPEESLDAALARGELIASNEGDDDRQLLLGTVPGRHVAVAAAYRKKKTGGGPIPIASGHPSRNVTVSVGFDPFANEDVFRTYFSREAIESTLVAVEPGSFLWAGKFVVKQSRGIAEGDEIQKRHQEILEGKAAKRSGMIRMMQGTYSYRGSIHEIKRDAATEAKFLEKATKRLRKKQTDWADLLEKRQVEIQAAASTGR